MDYVTSVVSESARVDDVISVALLYICALVCEYKERNDSHQCTVVEEPFSKWGEQAHVKTTMEIFFIKAIYLNNETNTNCVA